MSPSRLVASFGGIGFFPVAPGTAGSLAALLLGAVCMQGPSWLLPLLAIVASLVGLMILPSAVTDPEADPGWVVIDEVAGQCVALLGLSAPTPLGLIAAFLLFRVLDITKPGPIGWADRQPGAQGIMLDDIIAGAVAAGILWTAHAIGIGGLE